MKSTRSLPTELVSHGRSGTVLAEGLAWLLSPSPQTPSLPARVDAMHAPDSTPDAPEPGGRGAGATREDREAWAGPAPTEKGRAMGLMAPLERQARMVHQARQV